MEINKERIKKKSVNRSDTLVTDKHLKIGW